jgi:hypothetical protein
MKATYTVYAVTDGTVTPAGSAATAAAAEFLNAHPDAAPWSSTDPDTGVPLDRDRTAADLDPETVTQPREDCDRFRALAAGQIAGRESDAGHDFWMTRNGHGVGFWDGDWPEHGDELTAPSHPFGECDTYPGDDGWLHAGPVRSARPASADAAALARQFLDGDAGVAPALADALEECDIPGDGPASPRDRPDGRSDFRDHRGHPGVRLALAVADHTPPATPAGWDHL